MFLENNDELVEHKLLILYILETLNIPMTNTEITQFILENNYMNYFLVQQFLGELVNSKFVEFSTRDGYEYYHLSNAGKDTLTFFGDRISEEVKEDITNKSKQTKQDMIKDTQIIGNYFKKSDSEYIVNLRAIEKDIVLINLSLSVVSNKQAKLICGNWKQNPETIYKNIFDLLITE